MSEKKYIKVTEGGPYLVFGISEAIEETLVADEAGASWQYQAGQKFKSVKEPMALCRCGNSSHKPFCDGTHAKVEWDSAEKANFEPILDNVKGFQGERYTLLDNEEYCSYTRFCDAKGRVWNLVGEGTFEADELCKREVCNCPSGRLMLKDNQSGEMIEEKFAQTISLIIDKPLGKSGPIWVKGGIEVISSQGKAYEVRNRQTLCRCAKSQNKPFCDGSHAL